MELEATSRAEPQVEVEHRLGQHRAQPGRTGAHRPAKGGATGDREATLFGADDERFEIEATALDVAGQERVHLRRGQHDGAPPGRGAATPQEQLGQALLGSQASARVESCGIGVGPGQDPPSQQ